MLRLQGDVLAVQKNSAGVGDEAAGNCVEQRGFSGAVCADDGYKIPVMHRKGEIVEGQLGIRRSGIKGFEKMLKL